MAKKENTADLKKKIAELEARLKKKISFQVSQKGGVSVYGLRRFPITLYYDEWKAILNASDELENFLEKNKRSLKIRSTSNGDEDDE